MMDFLLHMLNIFSKIKLRARGIKISGSKIYIRKKFRFIGNPENIEINGREGLYIGQNSMITCSGRGGVKIGLQFSATENLRLTCLNRVEIGDYVLLGSSVTIIDCNHGMYAENSRGYAKQEMLLEEVCIENGVWCGDHVIILLGVTIGQHSIIGAGSVVVKSIPEYCIAAGNPAKVMKKWNFLNKNWEKV